MSGIVGIVNLDVSLTHELDLAAATVVATIRPSNEQVSEEQQQPAAEERS